MLTPHGFEVLRRAAPGHVEDVRRSYIDLFDADELAVFGEVWERIASKLRADG